MLQNRPCEEGAGPIFTNLEENMPTLSNPTFGRKTWHQFAIGWILLSCVLQGPGPFGRRSGIETVLEQQRILWALHLHILPKRHKPLVGFGSPWQDRQACAIVCLFSEQMCPAHGPIYKPSCKEIGFGERQARQGSFWRFREGTGIDVLGWRGALWWELYEFHSRRCLHDILRLDAHLFGFRIVELRSFLVAWCDQQRASDGSSSLSRFPENCHVAQESFLQRHHWYQSSRETQGGTLVLLSFWRVVSVSFSAMFLADQSAAVYSRVSSI